MEISREIASGYMQTNRMQGSERKAERASLESAYANRMSSDAGSKSMDKVELSGTAVSMADGLGAQRGESLENRAYVDSRDETVNRYAQMAAKAYDIDEYCKTETEKSEVDSELIG